MTLEGELDKAGYKPSKEERRAEAARARVLERYLGEDDKKKSAGFADPALMFK
jgi:hypothetical protein